MLWSFPQYEEARILRIIDSTPWIENGVSVMTKMSWSSYGVDCHLYGIDDRLDMMQMEMAELCSICVAIMAMK